MVSWTVRPTERAPNGAAGQGAFTDVREAQYRKKANRKNKRNDCGIGRIDRIDRIDRIEELRGAAESQGNSRSGGFRRIPSGCSRKDRARCETCSTPRIARGARGPRYSEFSSEPPLFRQKGSEDPCVPGHDLLKRRRLRYITRGGAR